MIEQLAQALLYTTADKAEGASAFLEKRPAAFRESDGRRPRPRGPSCTVGDDVMGIVRPEGTRGGYAEYVVVPAASVCPLPKGTNHVAASIVPMNGLTALFTLHELGLAPGRRSRSPVRPAP